MSRGTQVKVTDIDFPSEYEVKVIKDDYVLVSDGTCQITGTQVWFNKDGTPKTHVITVKYDQEQT